MEWKAIPNVGSKYLATLVFQKGVISDAVGKKHILRVAELRKNHLPYFVCIVKNIFFYVS